MTVAVGAMLFFLDFGRELSYYLAIRIYQSIFDYIVRRTYSHKVYTRIQKRYNVCSKLFKSDQKNDDKNLLVLAKILHWHLFDEILGFKNS